MEEKKTIIMSGFDREELFRIVRGVRSIVKEGETVAFGSLTEHNKSWTLEALIEELHKEHDEVKKLEETHKS